MYDVHQSWLRGVNWSIVGVQWLTQEIENIKSHRPQQISIKLIVKYLPSRQHTFWAWQCSWMKSNNIFSASWRDTLLARHAAVRPDAPWCSLHQSPIADGLERRKSINNLILHQISWNVLFFFKCEFPSIWIDNIGTDCFIYLEGIYECLRIQTIEDVFRMMNYNLFNFRDFFKILIRYHTGYLHDRILVEIQTYAKNERWIRKLWKQPVLYYLLKKKYIFFSFPMRW